MSKALSITVHPAPLKGEYLTVSDAMKQVLDLIDAVEKVETIDGGDKTLVWRLTEAHTNSPPFTVVAEAFPVHPSISISLEAARVSDMFVSAMNDLLTGAIPDWFDVETGRPIKRALERNTNGISRTVIAYGDDVTIDIAPQAARIGIATLERMEIESDADKVDWSRTEYGSAEGEVYGLTRWNGRPALLMIERLSDQKFTCVLDDELASRVGPSHSWVEAWDGRRLLVSGALHYNADGILKRADIIDLEERPFTDVRMTDLREIDLLRGLSVSEHISRLRGEDNG